MSKKTKFTVSVDLNEMGVDQAVQDHLAALEKEVQKLKGLVTRRDATVERLREGKDVSKLRREALAQRAEHCRDELATFIDEMQEAGWTEIDDYYGLA